MKVFVIIPAAGLGTRMTSRASAKRSKLAATKQFAELDGVPVLVRTLANFASSPDVSAIYVALRAAEIEPFRARLQKDFKLREKTSLQLLAEGFNLANHRNITGVTTGAFSLSTSNVLTSTTNFGQPSSSGVNGNYAYQVRQFQFGARLVF